MKVNNHTSENCRICAFDKESDNNKRLTLEEALIIILDKLDPKGQNSRNTDIHKLADKNKKK